MEYSPIRLNDDEAAVSLRRARTSIANSAGRALDLRQDGIGN
jgi:hypothetical protein